MNGRNGNISSLRYVPRMEPMSADAAPVMSEYQPVLGTVLELCAIAADTTVIAAAEQRALAEIDRLELVFSVYDDASELCRWRRGVDIAMSGDLVALLETTALWFGRGRGAFNPSIRVLMDLWRGAAASGRPPPREMLREAARSIATLPFAMRDGRAHRRGDCRNVELNALAKGYIVDRAAAAACSDARVSGFMVSLGGDLVHRGVGSMVVGIEDPHRPYDNAPPRVAIEISNQGLATSGSARRGFQVGDQWFGHVLDPRSGDPVDHVLSASVIAPDACTADVVATIVGVLGVHDGPAFADTLDAVGVCLIDRDGTRWCNAFWRAHECE